MTKRNTTGDFGSPRWIEDFYKQESLTRIINSTYIEGYEFNKVERRYSIDDDRVGAIVQIKKNGRTLRAIIDFKRGDVAWDQIIDTKFNIGNDCDFLIAVHGDSRNSEDMRDGDIDAEYLVDVLIAYGVKAYLVSAERQPDEKGQVKYEYLCAPGQKYSSETISEKLPSKRAFEEAEFWMLHHHVHSGMSCNIITKPSDWSFGCEGSGGDLYGLRLRSKWTDKGIFMNAKPETEEGINTLEWIWANKRKELRGEYQNCKIRMNKKGDRPSNMSVRILEKPFTEFPYLDYHEKGDLGEMIYYGEDKFYDLINELLADMPPMKMAVNS